MTLPPQRASISGVEAVAAEWLSSEWSAREDVGRVTFFVPNGCNVGAGGRLTLTMNSSDARSAYAVLHNEWLKASIRSGGKNASAQEPCYLHGNFCVIEPPSNAYRQPTLMFRHSDAAPFGVRLGADDLRKIRDAIDAYLA